MAAPPRTRARLELWPPGCAARSSAGVELTTGALEALTHPERALTGAREAAEGVGEIVWAGLNPAPADAAERARSARTGASWASAAALDDFKIVKNAFGGTVNDVVLAVVTGALRSFLISRGVRTEGVELRALVPVSVRAAGRAPPGGQPHRGDARAAAGLHRRSRAAPALRRARRWTG